MIQKNEIRIGNYLLDEELTIIKIDEGWEIDNPNRYEPIELTEEILLKIRNIKKKEGKFGLYYYIEPFSALRFFFNGESMTIIKDDKSIIWIADKKYLHEFQNLYYILTNIEPVINF